MIAQIVGAFPGMTIDDLSNLYNRILADVPNAVAQGPDAGANQASIAAKGAAADALKEDVAKIFEGEDFTDDFKARVAALIEASVTIRVSAYETELAEASEAKLNEMYAAFTSETEDKINRYATHVAEEYIKENVVAIDSEIRVSLAERFMDTILEAAGEYNVQLPEGDDIVAGLQEQVETLTEKLNKQIEKNAMLAEQNRGGLRAAIVTELSTGLAATQVEKLKELTENVTFENAEQFREAVKAVKEKFVVESVKKPETGLVVEEVASNPSDAPAVKKYDGYARYIAAQMKR